MFADSYWLRKQKMKVPAGQKHTAAIVRCKRLGGHHSISRGGGGTGVFVAGKLFISTNFTFYHMFI